MALLCFFATTVVLNRQRLAKLWSRNFRNVFTLLDRIVADLDAFRGGARGHVRVHAHMSAMAGSLPEVLARFIAAHPGIEIVLEEYTSIEILHAVQTGTADVGVISGAMQTGILHVIPWHNDRLVVVLPQQHALLERQHLRLADLRNSPLSQCGWKVSCNGFSGIRPKLSGSHSATCLRIEL